MAGTLGLLVAVAVTAANLDGGTHAPRVLRQLTRERCPRLGVVYGDNEYNNRTRGRYRKRSGAQSRVEIRPKAEGQEGSKPVPIRWAVGQAHALLGRCHRLSRGYECETSSSAAWVRISAIRQMIRRLRPDAEHRQPPFKDPKEGEKVA